MAIWTDLMSLFSALASQDSFEIRNALRAGSMYIYAALFLLASGWILAWVYHHVPMVERYFERTIMIVAYLSIAGIIFWGVIDRFVFSNQQPWSTTIPPLLFMVMAWFGASYNVRLRTHLSFSEFRMRMPRGGQFFCLMLDAVLWLGFAWIVVVTTTQESVRAAANFSIMLGTDNVLQWWFLATVPVAFILLTARVMQNVVTDMRKFREGGEMIETAVIGGDA